MGNIVKNILIMLTNLKITANPTVDLIDNEIRDKTTRTAARFVPETASETDGKTIEMPK